MIGIIAENDPLPQNEDRVLRTWLSAQGVLYVERVIMARVADELSKYANEAMLLEENPNRVDAAKEALKQAKKYQTFLDVLGELQVQASSPNAFCKTKLKYEQIHG